MTVVPGGASELRPRQPPGRAMLLTWKSRLRGSFCLLSGVLRSSSWRSASVRTAAGDAFGTSRLSIVSHDMRQATTQHRAIRFARRSAVARLSPSIRHPAFRRIKLFGTDDLKILMPVFPLLPDRWANRHRSVPDRDHGAMVLALRIAKPNLVSATGLHLGHHPGKPDPP